MRIELDHLFVCTAPDGPEAEELVRFGLREGTVIGREKLDGRGHFAAMWRPQTALMNKAGHTSYTSRTSNSASQY